jgi:hypothetical protein
MNSKVDTLTITPELAMDILSKSGYEFQRPMRNSWIEYLANEMTNGRFLTNTIVFCKNGTEKKYLVNGHHTLNAIVKSGVTLSLPVETFQVSNYDEIASIYARIDKQRKRTRMDTLRAYNLEERLGLPWTTLERFAASAYILLNDFRTSTEIIPDFQIVDFMEQWQEYAKQYTSVIENSPITSIMLRRDVFSVGLVTIKGCENAAEFWRPVATDDGLNVGDPRKTLHIWLRESGMSGGGAAGTNRRRIINVPIGVRAVALAWNAWRENSPLKIIRIVNPSLPFSLKGTMYKSGHSYIA